jgi:hypothetical protein
MSHNSSISGMGEPVPAIRVINEKQMLLTTGGINIMLKCGNVVSCLDMYHTKVLMYHMMVLMVRLTKVRR